MRDKVFNVAKNPKHDDYQRGLASIVYKFFDKKFSGGANKFTVKNENMSKRELSEKLHKSITGKFKKYKVWSAFIDNIWGADLEKYAINKQVW